MDTEQLLAFARVVREGSFSRAARTLNIGQPAISARIQALESQLGGALLTRGRPATVTPLGASFLPFVERALEMLDDGVRSAQRVQSGDGGRVTLACLGSLAGDLLGPALAAFLRARPGVECSMRSGAHEFVLQLLADGVVDLGLIAWPCRDAAARELTSLLVLREPVVLAVHPNHALARRANPSRADLVALGRPLLRLRWWPEHHPELEALARQMGSTLEIPMEPALHLVRQGLAVGFFPRSFIGEALAREELVALQLQQMPALERRSALVRRSRPRALDAVTRDLVEALRERARLMGLLAPGRAARPRMAPSKR